MIPAGLTTGIGVSPVLYRTPIAFAMSGGTVSQLTGGRFIMGIGAGGSYRPRTRQSLGLPRLSTLALMRDYLMTVRRLVAGDEVNYQGEVVTLQGSSWPSILRPARRCTWGPWGRRCCAWVASWPMGCA